MACCGMQILHTPESLVLLISAICIFYFPTWEHLNTGVMIFREGPLNPTESLVMSQLSFLITAFYPNMWTSTPSDILEVFGITYSLPSFHFQLPFNVQLAINPDMRRLGHLLVLTSVLSALKSAYSSISTVTRHHKIDHSTSLLRVFSGLLPLLSLCACSVAWLLVYQSLGHYEPIRLLTICIPFAYSVFHIIIAEITQSDLKPLVILLGQAPMYIPLIPFYFPALQFLQQHEILLVQLTMILSLAIYTKSVVQGVGEACFYLDMPHFWSIPKFLKNQGVKKVKTTKST